MKRITSAYITCIYMLIPRCNWAVNRNIRSVHCLEINQVTASSIEAVVAKDLPGNSFYMRHVH